MAQRGTTGMLEFMEGQGFAGDNAAADCNCMLLASALGRRFNDHQLQNDPRLQRVVADARWAASSIDTNLLVPKGDANPRSVLDVVMQDQLDARAYIEDSLPKKPLPKRKPPLPKKKATKKKKVFAAFDCFLTCVC
jgi:hypothetical protein